MTAAAASTPGGRRAVAAAPRQPTGPRGSALAPARQLTATPPPPAPRTAWISGASRGIGRAIALALARDGCRIIIHYQTQHDAARAVADEVVALGGTARLVQADGCDADAIATACKALDDWNSVDYLVVNAGINLAMPLPLQSPAAWRQVLATNLDGAFYLTKALARPMIRRRCGRIVYISSAAALVGDLLHSAYSASKAGLLGLAKSAAREFAASNITVNVVAPGPIETDMTVTTAPATRQKQESQIPLGRFGQAAEVAAVVRFLLSERAAYITGQVLSVDGGLCMKPQP